MKVFITILFIFSSSLAIASSTVCGVTGDFEKVTYEKVSKGRTAANLILGTKDALGDDVTICTNFSKKTADAAVIMNGEYVHLEYIFTSDSAFRQFVKTIQRD